MGTGEVLEAGILRGQEVGFPKGRKAGEKQYITYKTSAKKARKLNKKGYGGGTIYPLALPPLHLIQTYQNVITWTCWILLVQNTPFC